MPDLPDSMQGGQTDDQQDDQGGDDSNAPTVLVNREACPDCQPGDTIQLHVVRVHENELECVYAGKESGETANDPDDQSAQGAPEQSDEPSLYD